MLIPNSEIQQVATTTQSIWYRVGKSLHVTTSKGRDNQWHYRCMTCRTTDSCVHAKAVKRYAELPKAHHSTASKPE